MMMRMIPTLFPPDPSPSASRRRDRAAHNLCDAYAAALCSADADKALRLCGDPKRLRGQDAEALAAELARCANACDATKALGCYLRLFCDAWTIADGSGADRVAPIALRLLARATSGELLGHAIAAYTTVQASGPQAERFQAASEALAILFAEAHRHPERVPYVAPATRWNTAERLRDLSV